MILLKRYKSIGFGLVITIIGVKLLDYLGVLLIERYAILENTLIFLFWWIIISYFFFKIPYFIKNLKKNTVYKILGLLGFLIIIWVSDLTIKLPDQIKIALLITFWFGFIYLIVPSFIKKYWKLIIIIYGSALLYFIYIKLFSADLETYMKLKDEMVFSFFLVPIPILFGLWVFEQWKWVKALQAEKSKAELSLLKSQINPHFFFNTLNNLYALALKKSNKAPEVILKLSEMMRYTIYEGKNDLVSLKEEIEYLKNYLDLHEIRYHKTVNLKFTQNVIESDRVAPLLFINLLENAFKHGVEKLTGDAYIYMSLKSNSKEIIFTIENNFNPNEETREKGIGMENLNRRLAITYPNSHEIEISKEIGVYKVDLKINIA